MKCPNCGAKLFVADNVPLPSGDEIYRLRFCKECGEIVYTTEYIVEKTDSFMKSWTENHRNYSGKLDSHRRYHRYTAAELNYIKVNCHNGPTLVAAHLGRSTNTVRKLMSKFRKEKENG